MQCSLALQRIDRSAPRHTIAAIGSPSLLKSLLTGDPFPRGTLCAFVGLVFISLFYRDAWRKLGKAVEPLGEPLRSEFPDGHSWPELRYLQIGAALSVAVFVLAGAADPGMEWLDQLRGAIFGFCGALAVGILGFGLVCLMNLWKELILQLRRAGFGSLLVAIPLAILWLAMGVGAFLGLGMLAEKLGVYLGGLLRSLSWALIALIFCGLWRGRSRAALMLRVILMIFFSAIILHSAVVMRRRVSSEARPPPCYF